MTFLAWYVLILYTINIVILLIDKKNVGWVKLVQIIMVIPMLLFVILYLWG